MREFTDYQSCIWLRDFRGGWVIKGLLSFMYYMELEVVIDKGWGSWRGYLEGKLLGNKDLGFVLEWVF